MTPKARRRFEVLDVSAEDISGAKRGYVDSCPIARALIRAGWEDPEVRPQTGFARVKFARIYFSRIFALGRRARRFALDFDAGRPVAPTTLRLKVVEGRP
jgi:hypothetical protein